MINSLKGDTEGNVWLNGEKLNPAHSQRINNHSPDGFSWGYGGSAPSQLALAIMLKLTGKSDGYMDLKFNVIAKIPFAQPFDIKFQLNPIEIVY